MIIIDPSAVAIWSPLPEGFPIVARDLIGVVVGFDYRAELRLVCLSAAFV